jgi:carbon monoxide dehydrogenase subunit G
MKLVNELSVAADVKRTWSTLLDIERVATCLPGATIEPGDTGGNTYRGRMKVKLGPMNIAYEGTARLAEVDEDERVATLEVQGREEKGQGTAAATITNRLVNQGASTLIVVETDLKVTGRPAQFGRSLMEDIAGKMLNDFAGRLEREILSQDDSRPDQVETAPPAADESDVLDLGNAVVGPVLRRAAPAIGVLVVAGLIILGILRRTSRD